MSALPAVDASSWSLIRDLAALHRARTEADLLRQIRRIALGAGLVDIALATAARPPQFAVLHFLASADDPEPGAKYGELLAAALRCVRLVGQAQEVCRIPRGIANDCPQRVGQVDEEVVIVVRAGASGRRYGLLACGAVLATPGSLALDLLEIAAPGAFDWLDRAAVAEERHAARLTVRQIDCLRLAYEGHKSTQIGWRLGLTAKTVDSYLSAAARRLHVNNRTAAVAAAAALGLVP